MRSGLGPADHLRTLGIDVLEDLDGVGENLIDHPLLGLRFAASAPAQPEAAPGFQAVLTWKSALASHGYDLHIFPMSILPADSSDSPSGAQFLIFVSIMKPLSRGHLRLRSSDPAAAPLIDLGYFTHPHDMPRLIEAIRIARRLSRTSPLSELNLQELYPGQTVSDAEDGLEMAVRAEVETYHHPVGACRMGPATDAQAVVDARGNAHGVEGLSIVDASIMPTIPAANTHLPVIMVAERCAAYLIGSPRVQSRRHEEVAV
jgi:choline dehydrogenase